MKPQTSSSTEQEFTWTWPLAIERYDRHSALSEAERSELDYRLGCTNHPIQYPTRLLLHRLLEPIEDVLEYLNVHVKHRPDVRRVFLIETQRRGVAFWGWTIEEWRESICPDWMTFSTKYGWSIPNYHPGRRYMILLAYLLNVHPDIFELIDAVVLRSTAQLIFGEARVQAAIEPLLTTLQDWGYKQKQLGNIIGCVCYLLLRHRTPYLQNLSSNFIENVHQSCLITCVRDNLYRLSRALFALGYIKQPLADPKGAGHIAKAGTDGSVNEEWLHWCQRWEKQTTQQTSKNLYYALLNIGRWLNAYHPEITSPEHWTYEVSAEFVAAVHTMKIGEWSDAKRREQFFADRIGDPLRPNAKERLLRAMRTFLRDCQEWGWIPLHINPHRALRTPRPLRNLLGPDPRGIDKVFWAKIMWAMMNMEPSDIPPTKGDATHYPFEMLRALAAVWCFSALRSDEIHRLRVGCIRWQHNDVMVPETGQILPKDAVCFLDIPINKTSMAYTKAVHPLVGKYINAWEQLRPKEQLRDVDKKTGEAVQFLFAFRGMRISKNYITSSLIPLLCRKAGIPGQDSRGNITSHRARATIASMLYNAREPLDVFEIKEYLGHKYLSSTQHYLRVDPTKLATNVAKAGYLEQNLATIEVLLDQDAVRSGAAAHGETWKYYDLGHGYCVNDFWADCKHRMACARCPFYRPKDSLKEQLIEGQANLVRMLEFVKLTEDEKLLVTEGIELHQALIEQLANTPTPAGPTPRELVMGWQGEAKIIPIQSIGRTTTSIEHSTSQLPHAVKKQRVPRSQSKKEQEKHGDTSEGG